MKVYETNEIKNVALIGSKGSGKTTLAEAMLYECGVIKRRGTIDGGNTVCDYFPVEKEYGYSVFSTVCHAEFLNKKLNVIDCPGGDDFVGSAITALNVTDTGVLLIDAQYGVEVGTQNIFRTTAKVKKPVIFAINQLDSDKVDFDNVIQQMKDIFGNKIVLIQYPINPGTEFNAMIDVLLMKKYSWGPDGGVPTITEIPEEELDKAKELNKILIEAAAENDETLMEKFFDQGVLTEDEMREGIRKGLASRSILPVFCVSALKDMGVRRMMEFLGNVVPFRHAEPHYAVSVRLVKSQKGLEPALAVGGTGGPHPHHDAARVEGVQQHLAAHSRECDREDVRRRALPVRDEHSVGDGVVDAFCQVFYIIAFFRTVCGKIAHRSLRCDGKRLGGGSVLGAGAEALLLPSAVDERTDGSPLCDIERAYALGRSNLVPGDGVKIDAEGADVHLHFAERLHSVAVENRFGRGFFGHFDEFCDVVHRPRLVAHMHDGDQRDIWGEQLREFLLVHAAVGLYGRENDVETLLFEQLCGVDDRVVLPFADDDAAALGFAGAKERGVVRFRAAGEEV